VTEGERKKERRKEGRKEERKKERKKLLKHSHLKDRPLALAIL